MNLNEAQRQRVTAWILQGAKLSEIQTRLADEFGLRAHLYGGAAARGRFEADAERPGAAEGHDPNRRHANNRRTTTACREKSLPDTRHATASHRRRVRHRGSTARPGAIVSGKVTFSDGQTADWYLDQTGRLGVVPKQQGYKPSAADVQQFQVALQNELARMGL